MTLLSAAVVRAINGTLASIGRNRFVGKPLLGAILAISYACWMVAQLANRWVTLDERKPPPEGHRERRHGHGRGRALPDVARLLGRRDGRRRGRRGTPS
jgi:hypothetical protein